MSYSAYGGFAYRNGVRVPERADVALRSAPESGEDLILGSTPGSYPGYEYPNCDHCHVVLGDGPVYVALIKGSLCVEIDAQTGAKRLVPSERVPDATLALCAWEDPAYDGDADPHFGILCRFQQADGVVWAGFCGSSVGAGHASKRTRTAVARLDAWLHQHWGERLLPAEST